MPDSTSVSQKPIALITGASSGIGLELSAQFAKHGYDLVLTARRETHLQELAGRLAQTHGIQAHVCLADLAQASGAEQITQFTTANNLHIDVLINNAGIGAHGAFTKVEPKTHLEIIQINIASLVQLTRCYLPAMLEKRRGGVMNIASTAAFVPGPLMAVYFATKAFVLSFSEALANECRGTGVSICCVCPGATITEFQARANISEAAILSSAAAMSAEAVAVEAYQGFAAGKPVVITGLVNKVAVLASHLVPRAVAADIARHVQEDRRRS